MLHLTGNAATAWTAHLSFGTNLATKMQEIALQTRELDFKKFLSRAFPHTPVADPPF